MKTINSKPIKISDKTKDKIELAKEISKKKAQLELLDAEIAYLEIKYNTFDILYKE